MHSELLFAIGLSIVAASVLAYVTQLIRQPLIIGYIAAGILIGPQGLKLITNQEEIALLSELGLAFLLFIVGLEIDVKKFSSSGRASAIIGSVQVVTCSVLGVLVAYGLGYSGLTAGYIGVTLAFSSTMVVVKLLSDRRELDTLPGRVSLGILLVQDVLAIFALAAQSNLHDPSFLPVALSIASGLALIALSFLASKFVLPGMFRSVAQNPELTLVLSIAWCFTMCWLALVAGFSIAMGALIAGVSISTFPYSHEVITKIRSLRDFFVTLFFVSLGMQIMFGSGDLLVHGLILSAFVIVSRAISIFPTAVATGLGSRVGVLSSIGLGQSSEFSLVIASLGVGYGHIPAEIISLIAVTLVITSTLTTYLMRISHPIAQWLLAKMTAFGVNEPTHAGEDDPGSTDRHGEIILLGCHRLGSSVVEELVQNGHRVRVYDFNPLVLERLAARGIPSRYVDISNFDAVEEAGLKSAALIVCTVSDEYLKGTTNQALVRFLKSRGLQARIIVQATSVENALDLYKGGADYVMFPASLSARAFVRMLGDGGIEGLQHRKEDDIATFRSRKEVL